MRVIIKARPTTYRGILMRSRLEAYFAAMLDGWPNATWEYEPECFAGPSNQWLPDFRVIHREDGCDDVLEYVEVKPLVMIDFPDFDTPEDAAARREATDAILRKMETAWLSVQAPASLSLYFVEADNGEIGGLLMLTCERPGEPWRWCVRGELGACVEIGQHWPGLGQGEAGRRGELREHGIARMAAIGIEVPR
jgi:hypothetical protein